MKTVAQLSEHLLSLFITINKMWNNLEALRKFEINFTNTVHKTGIGLMHGQRMRER